MAKRVIVAGGGVGGLSAAIHARLAGLDVVLYEQGSLGGKAAQIRQDGFLLDPGPSIIILPDIYRDVFRRAGKDPEEYLQFQRLDPITRVHFEGVPGFTDIPASLDGCVRLADSISTQDELALSKLFKLLDGVEPHIEKSVFKRPIHSLLQLLNPDIIAAGARFAQTKSYRQLIDETFESSFFRAFFYGFPSYSGQDYETRSMAPLLIPYLMIKQGVFYPKGGVAAIPQAFTRLARELGVQIETGAKVTAIKTQGGRVNSVMINGNREEKCDSLISNIDRITTQKLMGRPVAYSPSFSYFTVHWGLKVRFPDVSHHMLLVPEGFERGFELLYGKGQFPDPAIVYLNVTSELDPETAPLGCTNLFAVVSTPSRAPRLDWDALAVSGKAMILEQLKRLGWEIRKEDIVFERVQTPVYFEETHGNFMGSLYGPTEKERLFGGLFPLRCKDEQFRNLFYAGGSVQPGAGLPMVTLSGKFAADLVAGR